MTRVSLLSFAIVLVAGCKTPRSSRSPGDPAPEGPKTVAADIDIDMRGDEPKARAPQDLDVLLDEVLARSSVPGIAAAVIDRGGVLAIGASGRRRADEPGALQPDDRFHLGSDTKAMTAVLVARLVEEGELAWDMTMAQAFPDDTARMHEDFRDVTLTQLLRHRAGVVPGFTDFPEGFAASLEPLVLEGRRRAVAVEALSQRPRFTPGSSFEYSNFGYVIVGAAIEATVGKKWEEAMRGRVFEPLKMDSCGFGPVATPERPRGTWAHAGTPGQYVPIAVDNPPLLGPAATVHCTLEDWGRFVSVFFEGTTFLESDSIDRLISAVPTDDGRGGGYALGWTVPDPEVFGLPVLAHDGSNTYNYASAIVMPTLGAAVLVAVNAGDEAAQKAAVATALELSRRTRGDEG